MRSELPPIETQNWLSRLETDEGHTWFLPFLSYCQMCHSCPFSFALTFHLYLLQPGHGSKITLQTSLHSYSQSPIKAKSLPLLFRHPEPNYNISTGTCKGNCPCGKMSKPPIVALLLPLPRDTTAPSGSNIYLGVQIFPPSYCVASLEQQTVENVSVLRKGEQHNEGMRCGHSRSFPNMCVTNQSQKLYGPTSDITLTGLNGTLASL